MTIEIDTHAHTLVSGHAYNTMREMVQMAAEKGLKGLALTEHAPKCPEVRIYIILKILVLFRVRCTESMCFLDQS